MTGYNPSDYEIFTAKVKEFNGELVQVIGDLVHLNVRYEAWWTPEIGGFVLGIDNLSGKIGVYDFVGPKGAHVSEDVKWLERKHALARIIKNAA